MVCYNITAYNEIINFTVSKREVYNSKLRAGIKAERGMVMKGKNLERTVILGLLLSTGVYGTALAEIIPTIDESGKLIINTNETVGTNYSFQKNEKTYELGDFKNIEINFKEDDKTTNDKKRPLGIYSARYDLQDTNITVNVEGSSNNDALHLTNWAPHFYVHDFNIYMNADSSDAINFYRIDN